MLRRHGSQNLKKDATNSSNASAILRRNPNPRAPSPGPGPPSRPLTGGTQQP
eukprot:CAMPEP_0206268880 /NCGR_PEP_ID=MMETSP0047_2-20121206/31971_1 /ASSEMBLY_ACC=CAM_ASM_000192 /TAXON_ID=195065 /ORGANISM="Chroomonas mesostigmatica_cf, Strain CCMP1168" /LENGTH=51 /DNA_ID=CAMNT_0053697285 /DNA_START=42 /DNA_END=194 /DNA_ORIENTATION=-